MKLQPLCLQVFLFILIPLSGSGRTQAPFDSVFTGERLRIDYLIGGNASECEISGKVFICEPQWGGVRKNLLDTIRYGEMMVEITDLSNGMPLYSRGYSSLFKEWQTSEEARLKDTLIRETILIPFPRKPVNISIAERRGKQFRRLSIIHFDPLDTGIQKALIPEDVKIIRSRKNGMPENYLDIVLLSEGYTSKERSTFFAQAGELTGSFINTEPYRQLADRIRFHFIFSPSAEKGADDPGTSLFADTRLDATFNTMGSDRYLTCSDMQTAYYLASQLPYDQLVILVNTAKYGGAGIFNAYTVLSAGNEYAGFLFLHEFGHAFASLADEYYTSEVSYTDYFDLTTEPYQPNLTTLHDFDSKWKSMVNDTVPVPTPDTEKYDGVTGVFEGGGYTAKGIYRPFRTCIMKSKEINFFCPVCQKAIRDRLYFETDY